ncbi:hypothetical protein ACQP1P_13970 [Dactylosporangium sp. CA-052675]|uniref:hypothetical protein n=1 Tax=Dactylosporangium sp. CA-052675 TaxID=3239927 RepID=UPI003D8A0F54
MTLGRRRLLGLGAAAVLTGCGGPSRVAQAPAVTRDEAGLRAAVGRYLTATPENPRFPLYPGAVAPGQREPGPQGRRERPG